MSLSNQRMRLFGRTLRVLTALFLSAGTVLVTAGTASAARVPLPNAGGNGAYLALGDSVAFGYIPSQATPAPNYYEAPSFVSYANYVAQALRLHLTNASCPGETTASMISITAISNGCENTLGYPVGYRTLYPLHVGYTGSQLAYAVSFLMRHRNTRLVTIDIGANDAFVCQEMTADGCSSTGEIQKLLLSIETNLSTIYSSLRVNAGYQGPIVALNYYSLSYRKNTYGIQSMGLSKLLNSAIDAAGKPFGVIVAHGFAAFESASSGTYMGSPCAAGLLVPVPAADTSIPGEACNIHPSLKGHQVLAGAILAALNSNGPNSGTLGSRGVQMAGKAG